MFTGNIVSSAFCAKLDSSSCDTIWLEEEATENTNKCKVNSKLLMAGGEICKQKIISGRTAGILICKSKDLAKKKKRRKD